MSLNSKRWLVRLHQRGLDGSLRNWYTVARYVLLLPQRLRGLRLDLGLCKIHMRLDCSRSHCQGSRGTRSGAFESSATPAASRSGRIRPLFSPGSLQVSFLGNRLPLRFPRVFLSNIIVLDLFVFFVRKNNCMQ